MFVNCGIDPSIVIPRDWKKLCTIWKSINSDYKEMYCKITNQATMQKKTLLTTARSSSTCTTCINLFVKDLSCTRVSKSRSSWKRWHLFWRPHSNAFRSFWWYSYKQEEEGEGLWDTGYGCVCNCWSCLQTAASGDDGQGGSPLRKGWTKAWCEGGLWAGTLVDGTVKQQTEWVQKVVCTD